MKCKICDSSFEKNLIKSFEYWKVYIHPNQYYIGRCSIALKRHIEDITETNREERKELFELLAKLRESVKNAFDVNLINYYSAGNITRHLHVHFIPRYNHEVEFQGKMFKDELWGKNHSFYPRDFKIKEDLLNDIKQKIKSEL